MSRVAVALRLARRDLVRAKGRTALTLLMVALPVTAVTAADVLLRTDSSYAGTLETELGPVADAVVRPLPGAPTDVQQDASGASYGATGDGSGQRTSPERLLSALPTGSRLVTVARGTAAVALSDGPGRVRAELAPVGDPLLAGRYEVTRGRLPAAPGEVAVSPALAAAGVDLGTTTRDADGDPLRVVGVLPAGDRLATGLLALPGTTELGRDDVGEPLVHLVDSPEPVTWADVQSLNRLGAVVTSRAVLADPPDDTGLEQGGTSSRFDAAVFGLVAAMAVLEVVLLAGPAFAVGARRQRRALAQLAAAGGRPADLRRTVLAGALVLGTAAAVLGVGAGVGIAALARSTIAQLTGQDSLAVPVADLVVIAVAAVGSAVLAALGPARAAARQDPVTVLTDRRDPPRASRLPVVAALVLLVIGVLAAADGARTGDEVSVALAGVPTVLGAVLLAPLVLVLAARAAARLPFLLRYPLRDAARQRARTAPAVGAIAAVVAAAVALGIGASSDAEQYRAGGTVQPYAAGYTVVSGMPPDPAQWTRLAEVVRRTAPGTQVTTLRGARREAPLEVCEDATTCEPLLLNGFGSALATSAPVGPEALSLLGGIDERERAAGLAVLGRGGAVLFTDQDRRLDSAVLRSGAEPVRLPVTTVRVAPGSSAPAEAVLSEQAARELGLAVVPAALSVRGELTEAVRSDVEAALALRAPEVSLERNDGSEGERGTTLALVLLGAVAGALVLGGVLTSTLLALSDARPEFATLGALGAGRGTRRLLAAAYAAVLGLLGALLGVAAGFVPGVAVAFPLTREVGPGAGLLPPHLDVPWALLALLVVGVPALGALVAALTARGPLPGPGRKAMA